MLDYNDKETNEFSIAEYMRLRKSNIKNLRKLNTTSEQTSNIAIKNKMKDYEDSNKHDFISLILGVFGDSNFNTKFILFFISIYVDIVNGNKPLEQVLENLKNKKVIKNNENTNNNESDKVTVSFEVTQTDINKDKRKLTTINHKKQLF